MVTVVDPRSTARPRWSALVSPAFFLSLAASAAAVLLYLLLRRSAAGSDPAPLS